MGWDNVPVIEIQLGKEGLIGIRNRGLLPLSALIQLRNATLEDNSVRSGGGATKLGDAIGAVTIQAAIDYWPAVTTQRTLVSVNDGTLRKDNGSGVGWATLVSGLTTTGQVAIWVPGGAESTGRDRKAFHADGVNAVQVLAADAAAAAAIANPPAAWAGVNQPRTLFVHQAYLFGGGSPNDPHRLHRSLNTNHEDFLTTPYSLLLDPGAEFGEYIAAGTTFKGGAVVWKFPEGVFFIDTSDVATPANWRVIRVGRPGIAGPLCWAAVEDDLIWISPDGSWHLLSATQATGSVTASDISVSKLGSFFRDNANLAQLATAQMVYYANKGEIQLACHGQGQTAKNRRFHLDRNRLGDARWIYWDRDRNESLFLRKRSGIQIPAIGDNAGQIWELDRPARDAAGAAYTFEWWLRDIDFGEVVRGWRGRKTDGRFLQLEYDARDDATHTVEVYRDGTLSQTINFLLSGGAGTLPVTLPFTFGVGGLRITRAQRMLGQANRWGFRGRTTTTKDTSITRLLIGAEAA